MRGLLVRTACVVLAVAGSEAAHAAVYRIVAPDADMRAHLLAESGHAYLRYGPLALALATVLALLALVGEARGAARGGAPYRPRLLAFAAIAPGTFGCQEIFERLFHDGTFPWHAPLDRTFLLGVLLQLPFAVAAYLVAGLLFGAARVVGVRLGGSRAAGDALHGSVLRIARVSAPRSLEARLLLGARAPPPARV